MRLKRSQRLKWQDSHKVIGIWGLPFFAMIAFTGAFLGVIVLLAQAVAVIAFKGDLQNLVAAFAGPPLEPSGQQVQMLSIEELRDIEHPRTGEQPEFFVMRQYGDAVAEFDLFYPAPDTLRLNEVVTISGVTGAAIKPTNAPPETIQARIGEAITPLHYGSYGGIWLKILYFILGVGLSVVTALGSMMWIERRKHGNEGTKSYKFYSRLGAFNTGIVMGLPTATLSVFYLNLLYSGTETARITATGWTFFGIWALVVLFAIFRQRDYQSVRQILFLIGSLAIGIPVLNGFTTGHWFLVSLTPDNAFAWVDLSLLICGAFTIGVSRWVPTMRAEKAVKMDATAQPE